MTQVLVIKFCCRLPIFQNSSYFGILYERSFTLVLFLLCDKREHLTPPFHHWGCARSGLASLGRPIFSPSGENPVFSSSTTVWADPFLSPSGTVYACSQTEGRRTPSFHRLPSSGMIPSFHRLAPSRLALRRRPYEPRPFTVYHRLDCPVFSSSGTV